MSARLPPFQRFLDEQREVVWRVLVSSVGQSDAEDCFQETFIAALRAYPELRPGSNLRAWVLTIAQRKAIDVHRARARRALALADPSDVEASERASPRGDATAEASDRVPAHDETLWAAVGELPERQRSAVVLRFVADMRHREIAESIGCSEEAARSSLREGLNKLRKVVEV
ncbi:MAG TPA: RNA polymerase sigma factor [Solirubrobacteraceae bacterium]|jgi:RNA polymerase sigma factor (sigma-70 family)|nr:RNA polymerase sigma factor [Solirubrobacteraceae bacterium]